MSKLSFAGRVAIVTGAGTGIGKTYAQLLASRGAKVIVNDLGSDRSGKGQSRQADVVVNNIKENGGTAIASYDSVTQGEKIVQTALENFGRIDILINNAGILRDRSFMRISKDDWDAVHDVHLKGSFITTQAAWSTFKKQNFGRIVLVSSMSGICGNFGQTNYSAAKLGLVGLANTLALEGAKYNIHTNVIVPTSASRMTADILPPEVLQEFDPEFIAPVVAYMCHESNKDNGIVIESGAGWAAKHYFVRGKGAILRNSPSDQVTIERVQDQWQEIVDMSVPYHVKSIHDSFEHLASISQSLKSTSIDTKELKNKTESKPTVKLSDNELASDIVFKRISEKINANSEMAKKVDGVFVYNITVDGEIVKIWTMDLKTATVYNGIPKGGSKADATFTMSDSFMIDLMSGNIDIPVAFLKGDMKISGNVILTQKLVPFLLS